MFFGGWMGTRKENDEKIKVIRNISLAKEKSEWWKTEENVLS